MMAGRKNSQVGFQNQMMHLFPFPLLFLFEMGENIILMEIETNTSPQILTNSLSNFCWFRWLVGWLHVQYFFHIKNPRNGKFQQEMAKLHLGILVTLNELTGAMVGLFTGKSAARWSCDGF